MNPWTIVAVPATIALLGLVVWALIRLSEARRPPSDPKLDVGSCRQLRR